MKIRPFLLGLSALILLGACSTTDDPRKGGLIGYMGTGEKGYQKRIEEREDNLGQVQEKTKAEKSQAYGLQDSREGLAARLRQQREDMQAMDGELDNLRLECEHLQQLSDEKEIERLRILDELTLLQNRSRELGMDSTLLIHEKQAELDTLKKEVSLLLERYSLLTTL